MTTHGTPRTDGSVADVGAAGGARPVPPFRFRWYGWCGLGLVVVGLVSLPFCGWTTQVQAAVGAGAGLALAALLWACLRTCWLRR